MSTELKRRQVFNQVDQQQKHFFLQPTSMSSFVHFQTTHRSEFSGRLHEQCSNRKFKQSETWCNPVPVFFTYSVPTVSILQFTSIVDLPLQVFAGCMSPVFAAVV
jgi:hypothetical protein